jgi:hypothetical protein
MTTEQYETSTAHIEKFPKKQLTGVALNMILVRNWLSRQYPHLFPITERTGDAKKASKGTDWLELFDGLVGDNLTQIKGYQDMMVTDAFRIMNRRIADSYKVKRRA